jgi:hypothetical protein
VPETEEKTMNNPAAVAAIAVFLLVAVLFGSPAPAAGADGTSAPTAAVAAGK